MMPPPRGIHFATIEDAISHMTHMYGNTEIRIRACNGSYGTLYEGRLSEGDLGDLLYTLYKADIKYEFVHKGGKA
jgi:hypothetical protein